MAAQRLGPESQVSLIWCDVSHSLAVRYVIGRWKPTAHNPGDEGTVRKRCRRSADGPAGLSAEKGTPNEDATSDVWPLSLVGSCLCFHAYRRPRPGGRPE